jgi:multisubunit Na+/H+ antiporter MnhG subunit
VLLFVAAHWDWLSPAQRFALIVSLVALFHLGGAVASVRFPALQSTLHAVGTVCLGAGIFLAGQIFHLQEHWPGGVMLWAIGAWLAWALLRDWPQAALAALLTPVWLAGEWIEGTRHWRGGEKIIAEGLLLLCIAYLTAVLPERDTPVRKALMWIGGLALIPSAIIVGAAGYTSGSNHSLPAAYAALGWTAALGLPLALAWWLRGKAAWINAVAALWVVALGAVSSRGFGWREELPNNIYNEVGVYGLWILGSVGLISWGVHEQRRERINLGVAGFALTVLVFYYSTVMDKLGRAASLFGLGLRFLIGGWLLEKARRRLVAQVDNSSA